MKQPIFIIGERGSGKTTFAKQISDNSDAEYTTLIQLQNFDNETLKNLFESDRLICVDETYHSDFLLYLIGFSAGFSDVQLVFFCTEKLEMLDHLIFSPLYFNLSTL